KSLDRCHRHQLVQDDPSVNFLKNQRGLIVQCSNHRSVHNVAVAFQQQRSKPGCEVAGCPVDEERVARPCLRAGNVAQKHLAFVIQPVYAEVLLLRTAGGDEFHFDFHLFGRFVEPADQVFELLNRVVGALDDERVVRRIVQDSINPIGNQAGAALQLGSALAEAAEASAKAAAQPAAETALTKAAQAAAEAALAAATGSDLARAARQVNAVALAALRRV